MKHVCYSNVVSYDEDKYEYPKQGHTPICYVLLFKPVSHDGNSGTITTREDNMYDLASPGTHLPTQPPTNVILTDIDEENMSS